MKICVRTSEDKNINIAIPTFLLGSLLGMLNLGVCVAKPWIDEEKRQYLECVDFRLLKKSIKELSKYKGLTLLSVKSSDGDDIEIKL